jgi:hypothetical protein
MTDEEIKVAIGKQTGEVCKALSLSGVDAKMMELHDNIIYRIAHMQGMNDAMRAMTLRDKRCAEEAGYPH